MESTFDVFLTCLPRDVNEIVIKNLFRTIGNVSKVKIIDDKKNEHYKLCFVGFPSMDEAMEAVRLADRSTAFGEPIKASVSRKSLENYDSKKPTNSSNDFKKTTPNKSNESPNSQGQLNAGRGRGISAKRESLPPSFITKSVNLTDIKLKSKELIDVEIIDLGNLECICARPLKHTENSKVEITDLLMKVNASSENLSLVEESNVGECYLGKWDDGAYYRAELIEVLKDGRFKVTFVDEGTSGDIVSDIRHIPEGPLQQYPKQFTKISLGCKNSDELRNFIIAESDGKKVSLFWLGHFNNGVPLINLFLNEDEIVEKFIILTKIHVRESFSLKFKDIPNHTPATDCSSVSFLQSMYKSTADFTVQIREPTTVVCQKKTLLILPVPGDMCIYEKRNGVNNVVYLRCVVRRRQLFSFDIFLFDSGENLNNVSIDCLYAAEDIHKVSPSFSIICELDNSLGYSEDSFIQIMRDEAFALSVVSYKGNNRYLVTVAIKMKSIANYPEINRKSLLGRNIKVFVTHVASPIKFFVQLNEAASVEALNDIHTKLNVNYQASGFVSLDVLSVGQAVVAPFSMGDDGGENFRATVLEKRQQSPQVHVYYVDYGNDAWVDYKQLKVVDKGLLQRSPLALPCALDVCIKKEANNHAVELFSKLVGFTDDDGTELAMNVVKDSADIFIVDLTSLVKGSISNALDKSGTCTLNSCDKSGHVPKSMCNGDSATVHKNDVCREKPSLVDNNNSAHAPGQDEDYALLLKKLNELEQRLVYIEKNTPLH